MAQRKKKLEEKFSIIKDMSLSNLYHAHKNINITAKVPTKIYPQNLKEKK